MSMPAPVRVSKTIHYPTSDGKPMAETDTHRDDMVDLIETLKDRFADEPMVYVSGNILVYYVEGNPKKSISPDVLVVKGIPKHRRDTYLIWEEGKSLDTVIEVSSKKTRKEDLEKKFAIYRDQLKVPEYFLFDPRAEYLDPPLQGYHRVGNRYVRIRPVAGRLPSKVLGLHLERNGSELRLYDPALGRWLPTLAETRAAFRRSEEQRRAEAEARRQAEAEIERLRREIAAVRPNGPATP